MPHQTPSPGRSSRPTGSPQSPHPSPGGEEGKRVRSSQLVNSCTGVNEQDPLAAKAATHSCLYVISCTFLHN